MVYVRSLSTYVTALLLGIVVACGSHTVSAQFDFGGFAGRDAAPAEVTVESQFTPATDDRPAMLFVTATIADGFHISAIDQAAGGPLPTTIAIDAGSGVELDGEWQPIEPPKSHVDEEVWVGLELREHYEKVTWFAPVIVPDGVDPAGLTIKGTIEGQACNPQTCVPFEQAIVANQGNGIALPEAANSGSTAASNPNELPAQSAESTADDTPLLAILAYGVLGGLILNLMPCVLPVIGLKMLSFAEQGGQSRARILMLNLSYVGGLMFVFMVLATLAALAQLGLTSESYGWGELNTLTWFKVSMTALVFAMALSFLGIWELPIPGFATSGKATELAAREGPFGAFCMGIFTTLLATPCSGPFLGPVLGFTISQPPLIIFGIFFAVGFGMGLPYLLAGLFPSLVSWLPKPGPWMDTFKNLLGFVLLATVVFLFSTIKADYFLATLTLLFGIWFGCWMIGRLPVTAEPNKRRNTWLEAIAAATIVGGCAFTFLSPKDKASSLPWQPYSPQAVAAARAEGKVVMVDFTAQWCLTCKANLKFAINRPDVKKWVEEHDVVPLLADWTDRNDMIKKALLELNSRSIPLLAIYPPDMSKQPIVLPDLLTQNKVLQALAAAAPQQGSFDQSGMATKPGNLQAEKPTPSAVTR
ncbi:MAG: thioredoxin family protein [Planctomycetota bacterium]